MKGHIRILPGKIVGIGLLTGNYTEQYVTEIVDGVEQWEQGKAPDTAARAAMREAARRLTHLAAAPKKKKKAPAS